MDVLVTSDLLIERWYYDTHFVIMASTFEYPNFLVKNTIFVF